jgi:prolyl 4-hydroxylase
LAELAREDEDAATQLELVQAMALNAAGEPAELPAGEGLYDAPPVRHFASFLSPAECGYLVARANPLLSPSVVVDPATNRMVPHPVRTSDNMAFGWLDEDPVVHAINRRIAAVTGTQAEAGEPLQVLRYRPGQEYRLHHDALPGTDNQRIVTFLVYLNDGYRGGETNFPCLGLKIAGVAGTGLMFRNADANGRPDPASAHAGCPILAGEKFLATRWIHQQRFGPA